MTATLALMAALLLGEVRRETWPDGSPRAEYEVEVRANGREVRAGPYRSWHPGGAPESEGAFADDKETGRWKFFHASGTPAAVGSFARGARTGPWETFHADGTRASKGRYDKGVRVEEWRYWNEDGGPNALDSGVYAPLERRLANGQSLAGETVDGVPHGEWRTTWPDGAPLHAGRFVRGRREGPWRFHHPDGSVARLLSRTYAGGKPMGPAEVEPETNPATPLEIAPGALGRLEDPRGLARELQAWLAAKTPEEERSLELKASWKTLGVRALPAVLCEFVACDASTESGRVALGKLARVLLGLCRGHALAAVPVAPLDEISARELQRAWATLWAATADDAWFWHMEVVLTKPDAPYELLVERPFQRLFAALEPRPFPALYARRFEPRDRKVEAPLAAALGWLEANQLPNGRWSGCVDIVRPEDVYGPGVTGLALLALLGAGRGPSESPAIAAGAAWLLTQQDAQSGVFPAKKYSHDWIYLHLIATLALCEIQALYPSEGLRAPLQKAVDAVLRSQNPNSGWRYDLPPNGESDTSITSWAVAALVAAREAGLEGDFEGAFQGARSWFEVVTDPNLGRVGYGNRHELSARTPANESFPREKGEAMTAAGLFARRLLGVPVTDTLVEKQLALLEALPPVWDPVERAIDEYYFYYGAQAAALCDALESTRWDKGLEVLTRAQSGNRDTRGSWDPVGAWAYTGGRVYSTALLALALESPFRYTLADQADPKAKPKRK